HRRAHGRRGPPPGRTAARPARARRLTRRPEDEWTATALPRAREPPPHEARGLAARARDLATSEPGPREATLQPEAGDALRADGPLREAGLLGLAGREERGGGGQPYAVYLQVLEELAAAWLSVGIGVSVHTLSCHPVASYGADEQRDRWLPEMLGGELLGAYC